MNFDYALAAELFVAKKRPTGRYTTGFHGFATAARALQYAVEELPPASLMASVLEVDEERFDHRQIRALYDSADYPLPRKLPAAGHANDNGGRTKTPPAADDA